MSIINIPHQEPLIFAKEVLHKDDKTSQVLCKFDFVPTLAIFIEAAAQSSASFKDLKKDQIGFLTTTKNIKKENDILSKEYIFNITLEIDLGNISKFSFEAFDTVNNIKTVSGEFTVVLQE